jgi:hypothetical protein
MEILIALLVLVALVFMVHAWRATLIVLGLLLAIIATARADTLDARIERQELYYDHSRYGVRLELLIATGANGVKDMVFDCSAAGGSGTVMYRTLRTVFEVVPANAKRRFTVDVWYPQETKTFGCTLVRTEVAHVVEHDTVNKAKTSEAQRTRAQRAAAAEAERKRKLDAFMSCFRSNPLLPWTMCKNMPL